MGVFSGLLRPGSGWSDKGLRLVQVGLELLLSRKAGTVNYCLSFGDELQVPYFYVLRNPENYECLNQYIS